MTAVHASPTRAHVQPGQDGLWLSRPAASLVLAALRRFEQHEARANGTRGAARSPLLHDVMTALEATHRGDGPPLDAARFVDEPADPRTPASSSPVSRTDDRLTIKEAAAVLGHSEQYTRRLAAAEAFGVVEKVPQSTTVSRAAVAAYIAFNRSQNDDR